MKILYHHRVASKDGQYVHIEEIVDALTSLGHEIHMVAPRMTELSAFGSSGGVVSKLKAHLPKALYEIIEYSYSFFAFVKVLWAIWVFRPDVVYERYNLLFTGGIWAAKLCKIPILLEVNSPLYEEREEYGGIALKRLARWSEYYAWRNADVVLPVTHVLAEFIKRAGVPDKRISVIPNGVDTSRFNPALFTERLPELKGKCVIGFVGFCREWHHLDKVMSSLSSLKRDDIIFLLVGDGPVLSDLKELAKELKFEKQFISTGLVSRKEMPYWISQIDIALQPAVTPWASPLKLLEYLAMGKAVLADDSANIKELLTDDYNAVLFESGNLDDMSNKLVELVVDSKRVFELSKNSAKSISDNSLTWRSNAEKIVALHNNVCKEPMK
jgi:glycosyltransferase involved in cell wall biosynthesis